MLKKLSSTIVLQGINTALPFVTIPLYVHKLGIDGYGQIGVAIAIIQYLLMCVDFGFTLPSIRAVARSETKKLDASKIFANTIIVKLAIFLIGATFISIANELFSVSFELRSLVGIGYCLVLGQLLTPSWVFVGRQRGDLMLIFTIIPRIIAIPAIFFFIRQEGDLKIAMVLQVMPTVITAFFSIYWAISGGWMTLVRPNLLEMKRQIHGAWPHFISSAATSLYTSSTPIILNSQSGAYSAGVFLIADKLRQGLLAILPPISLVMYPKMAQEFAVNVNSAYFFIKKMTTFMLIGIAVFSVLVILFSENIIVLVFGNHAMQSISVLKILSASTIFTFLNTILGTYILLPLGAEKIHSKILVMAGFFHVACTLVLVAIFDYNGAAVGVLLTELFTVLIMLFVLMYQNEDMNKCKYKNSIISKIINS